MLIAERSRQPLGLDIADVSGAHCQHHLTKYREWQRGTEEALQDGGVTTTLTAEITPQKWQTYLKQWRIHKAEDAASQQPSEVMKGIERMVTAEWAAESSDRSTLTGSPSRLRLARRQRSALNRQGDVCEGRL